MPATPPTRPIADLPPALPVAGRLPPGDVAVFLDFDGTLSPLVDHADLAVLPPGSRTALAALAEVAPVAVVTGRDLDDVVERVGLAGLAYAGSHGFDLRHPDGSRHAVAAELLPVLAAAADELAPALAAIPGAWAERKRFAVAVHDRQVADAQHRATIAELCAGVADRHPELRVVSGKRIHELRPTLDWDKGRAVEALRRDLGLTAHWPLYLGDDVTDEDGFRAVRAAGGLAVVVRGDDDRRPTLAQAALADPDEVRTLLVELVAALSRRR